MTNTLITSNHEVKYVYTRVSALGAAWQPAIGYEFGAVATSRSGEPIYATTFGQSKVRGSGIAPVPSDRVTRYQKALRRFSTSATLDTMAVESSSSSSSSSSAAMPAAEDDVNTDEEESDEGEDGTTLAEANLKRAQDNQRKSKPSMKIPETRKDVVGGTSLAQAWPPAPTGSVYLICASFVTPPAGSVHVLSASPLNNFLTLLDWPIIVLEKPLDTSGSLVNLATTGSLQDDWATWLKLVLSAGTIAASATGTDTVSNFYLELNVPLSNPAASVDLHFSTATLPKIIQTATASALPFGWDANSNYVLFGLDFSASQAGVAQSWTLQQALNYFGVPTTQMQGLVETLGLAIPLYIINPDDPTVAGKYADVRNAIWFDASNYSVHQRLEFSLGTGALSTVNSWVKKVFADSLTITEARLMGRMHYSRRKNGDPQSDALPNQPVATQSWSNTASTPAYTAAPSSDMSLVIHLTSPKLKDGISGYMIFNPTQGITTFVLVPDPGTTLYDMVDWMADVLGSIFSIDISSWLPKQSNGTDAHVPAVRTMSIQSDGKSIVSFAVDIELEVEFGKTPNSQTNICFFVSPARHPFCVYASTPWLLT